MTDFFSKTLKQKKIIKTNKTKKYILKQTGGFHRTFYNEIKNINNPDELACVIQKNSTIIYFIIDIFYKTLILIKNISNKNYIASNQNEPEHEKKTNIDNIFKGYIETSILQTVDKYNIITKIGFTQKEIKRIIKCINGNNKISCFTTLKFLKTNIHAVTASLINLNTEAFQSLFIRNDPELFNIFIKNLKDIFNLPDNFSNIEFNNLYNDAINNKTKKASFDRLIVKLSHTTLGLKGVIQSNYGRENFTRMDRPSNFTKVPQDIPACFKDIETTTNKQIFGVTNYLDVNNTFIESIFDKYNRNLIGGISGSSYYLHFLITKILKFPINKELLTKILCITILDYVPLWHSLEEILLTYSIEYETLKFFDKYTMDKDPVEYFKNILTNTIDANRNYKIEKTEFEEQEEKNENEKLSALDMLNSSL